MIRRTVLFSGNVQGVGFRYTAREIARGFDVRGHVRNLRDGKVELVAEGEEDELNRFIDAILQKMEGFVKNHTVAESRPTGEFSDFSVRH